ncbi:proteoglycan 4 [Lingula anatina]|uniref:Proteoglycan 4 n=1 Tax=Lingula anatina TaxID=7574 RepID=A0A1S3J8J5_LINAN|nr:proteoglycan 4 [Lingula anatina]|eukprot:XP_013406189.1 proteoglycan 4 [Lingula anatina]
MRASKAAKRSRSTSNRASTSAQTPVVTEKQESQPDNNTSEPVNTIEPIKEIEAVEEAKETLPSPKPITPDVVEEAKETLPSPKPITPDNVEQTVEEENTGMPPDFPQPLEKSKSVVSSSQLSIHSQSGGYKTIRKNIGRNKVAIVEFEVEDWSHVETKLDTLNTQYKKKKSTKKIKSYPIPKYNVPSKLGLSLLPKAKPKVETAPQDTPYLPKIKQKKRTRVSKDQTTTTTTTKPSRKENRQSDPEQRVTPVPPPPTGKHAEANTKVTSPIHPNASTEDTPSSTGCQENSGPADLSNNVEQQDTGSHENYVEMGDDGEDIKKSKREEAGLTNDVNTPITIDRDTATLDSNIEEPNEISCEETSCSESNNLDRQEDSETAENSSGVKSKQKKFVYVHPADLKESGNISVTNTEGQQENEEKEARTQIDVNISESQKENAILSTPPLAHKGNTSSTENQEPEEQTDDNTDTINIAENLDESSPAVAGENGDISIENETNTSHKLDIENVENENVIEHVPRVSRQTSFIVDNSQNQDCGRTSSRANSELRSGKVNGYDLPPINAQNNTTDDKHRMVEKKNSVKFHKEKKMAQKKHRTSDQDVKAVETTFPKIELLDSPSKIITSTSADSMTGNLSLLEDKYQQLFLIGNQNTRNFLNPRIARAYMLIKQTKLASRSMPEIGGKGIESVHARERRRRLSTLMCLPSIKSVSVGEVGFYYRSGQSGASHASPRR